MAAENVQTFTDGNFDDDVLKSGAPVLVDFWAEWCGPCKRLAPTVDALASRYAGKVTVGKLNVDENPERLVQVPDPRHPDDSIFKGGQVVESVVGLAQKDDLKKVIDKHGSADLVIVIGDRGLDCWILQSQSPNQSINRHQSPDPSISQRHHHRLGSCRSHRGALLRARQPAAVAHRRD